MSAETNEQKVAVFDELKTLDVTHVTVEYSGSGDEGQINDVVAFKNKEEKNIPKLLNEAIQSLCWDYLEADHGGWEINDGASGTFTFNVATQKIHLEHHTYYTASEVSEAEF
jgi:hypothetical protein